MEGGEAPLPFSQARHAGYFRYVCVLMKLIKTEVRFVQLNNLADSLDRDPLPLLTRGFYRDFYTFEINIENNDE